MADQRTDQEMDAEWKPNGRPQSTMARNFSDSLNSAFAIHSPPTTPRLENLAQSVSQKKAAVDSQTSELQALEARIKEMDRRLEQRNSRTSSPARRGGALEAGGGGGGLHRRPPVGDAFADSTVGEGVDVPGAAGGRFHGNNLTGKGGGLERKAVAAGSSPLADRTANPSGEQSYVDRTAAKMSGGVENASASARSPWMNTGEGETVIDERG